MDLFPANPFPSTDQIQFRVALLQEMQVSKDPLELPDAEVLSCHKQHQCGFATSAGIPPEQALDQMKDEGHRLYPEHKHRKGHGLTTLPIQLQPQQKKNDKHFLVLDLVKSFSLLRTILLYHPSLSLTLFRVTSITKYLRESRRSLGGD
jgi:hypothetical protein